MLGSVGKCWEGKAEDEDEDEGKGLLESASSHSQFCFRFFCFSEYCIMLVNSFLFLSAVCVYISSTTVVWSRFVYKAVKKRLQRGRFHLTEP